MSSTKFSDTKTKPIEAISNSENNSFYNEFKLYENLFNLTEDIWHYDKNGDKLWCGVQYYDDLAKLITSRQHDVYSTHGNEYEYEICFKDAESGISYKLKIKVAGHGKPFEVALYLDSYKESKEIFNTSYPSWELLLKGLSQTKNPNIISSNYEILLDYYKRFMQEDLSEDSWKDPWENLWD